MIDRLNFWLIFLLIDAPEAQQTEVVLGTHLSPEGGRNRSAAFTNSFIYDVNPSFLRVELFLKDLYSENLTANHRICRLNGARNTVLRLRA